MMDSMGYTMKYLETPLKPSGFNRSKIGKEDNGLEFTMLPKSFASNGAKQSVGFAV